MLSLQVGLTTREIPIYTSKSADGNSLLKSGVPKPVTVIEMLSVEAITDRHQNSALNFVGRNGDRSDVAGWNDTNKNDTTYRDPNQRLR